MAFAATRGRCGLRLWLTQRARLTLRSSSAKLSSSRLAERDEVLFSE